MITKHKLVLQPSHEQNILLVTRFRVWQKIVAWGTKFRVDYALRTGETLTPLAMATATAYAEVTENAIMTALESIDNWPAVIDADLFDAALHDAERAASHIIAGRIQFMHTTDRETHPRLYFVDGVTYRVGTLHLPVIGDLICPHYHVTGVITKIKVIRLSSSGTWVATLWIDDDDPTPSVAVVTPDDRDAQLAHLSTVLTLPITHLIKYDGVSTSYRLMTARGDVLLPSIATVLHDELFRQAVAGSVRFVLPHLKKIWPAIAQTLLDICEDVSSHRVHGR